MLVFLHFFIRLSLLKLCGVGKLENVYVFIFAPMENSTLVVQGWFMQRQSHH